MITQAEYDRLARQGYNRIPLQTEVLADLETPVSAYLKMAQGPYSYLLESVQGGEKWGRYSIIGLPCPTVIRVTGDSLLIEQEGEEIHRQETDDPLAAIQSIHRQFNVPQLDTLPRFNGGLVGYFSYDTVRYIEPHLADSDLPDPVGSDAGALDHGAGDGCCQPDRRNRGKAAAKGADGGARAGQDDDIGFGHGFPLADLSAA